MGGNGTSTCFCIGVRSNYSDNIGFASYGSMNVNDFVSGVVATIGTWFHVVATLNNNVMKMFINGELNMTQTLPALNVNNNIYIGRESGGRALNAYIQNVRIYDRALSDEEIKILYDLEKGDTIKVKMDKNTLYIGGELHEGL
jgi:hypothetical protein